jgi:hypothetical protein
METSMQSLKGQFQINDWQETTQSEHQGLKRTLANVKLEYSGDIVGTSELQYLLSYQADGSAEFVGFENLTASVKDVSGCIVLRHLGRFVDGVASSQFTVIPRDIDDKLADLKGEFTSSKNGLAAYVIRMK